MSIRKRILKKIAKTLIFIDKYNFKCQSKSTQKYYNWCFRKMLNRKKGYYYLNVKGGRYCFSVATLSDNNTYCIKKFEHIPPLPNIMYAPFLLEDNKDCNIHIQPDNPKIINKYCQVEIKDSQNYLGIWL